MKDLLIGFALGVAYGLLALSAVYAVLAFGLW